MQLGRSNTAVIDFETENKNFLESTKSLKSSRDFSKHSNLKDAKQAPSSGESFQKVLGELKISEAFSLRPKSFTSSRHSNLSFIPKPVLADQLNSEKQYQDIYHGIKTRDDETINNDNRSIELVEQTDYNSKSLLSPKDDSYNAKNRNELKDINSAKNKTEDEVMEGKESNNSKEVKELVNGNTNKQNRFSSIDNLADVKLEIETEKKPVNNSDLVKQSGEDKNSALVRVALDSEKWNVREEQKAQDSNSSSEKQSIKFVESNHSQKNKNENSNNENSSNKGETNKNSAEIITNLFGKEANRNTLSSKFSNNLAKEDSLKNTRRLYNELVQKAKLNLKANGTSNASILMRPHKLGRMTLNLEIFKNQVQAKILVESNVVKQILMDEMNYFQQELSRQGIQVEGLSIRVRENFESQVSEEKNSEKNTNDEKQKNTANKEQGQQQDTQQDFDKNNLLDNESIESSSVLFSSPEDYGVDELFITDVRDSLGANKHIDISI